MLQQAKSLGSDRGLKNLGLTQNTAEALPFADSSLDLITCRKAAHHFRGFEVTGSEDARVYLEFNDWAARTKVEAQEVDALRRDFQSAGPEVKAAFQVHPADEAGDFLFSWQTWVFRAVKG